MINWFFHYKTRKLEDSQIDVKDIRKSSKILFCLFTRYGDTIIDLVIIKEFIEHYPEKDYLIICPKQMQPYVKEITPKINSIAINKRNLLELIKLTSKLKKWAPDIGFNPWSTGFESSYFMSYCKKYRLYKNFYKPKFVNHYQIVREYLTLKVKNWEISELSLKMSYKKILICPESTDKHRSFSDNQLDQIIDEVNSAYKDPYISIASMNSIYLRQNLNSFIFKKNAESSQQFINLVKDNDLIYCADSAPLHISTALKKNVIVIFNSSKPEIVINAGDQIKIY